jgi:hypothetical protein
MQGQCFTWGKPQSYSGYFGPKICQSSKITSLHGGLHGHYLGLLRLAVQVAPSEGTRLANVWRVDFHWCRLLRLLLGLIRCEIEWYAKIETLYCRCTASRRMPSSRTTPWQVEVLREGLGRSKFLRWFTEENRRRRKYATKKTGDGENTRQRKQETKKTGAQENTRQL